MLSKYIKSLPENLQHKFLRSLLENDFNGITILNGKREIIFWNRSAKIITGFSSSEVLGKKFENFTSMKFPNKKDLCLEDILQNPAGKGKSKINFVYIRHKENYLLPVEIKFFIIFDEKSRETFLLGIFKVHDIVTYTKKLINSLKKRANQDFLTKLPNRRFLEFIINKKIQEFKRFSYKFGIILFDINKFKEINDKFGHSTGDRILREFSKTIKLNLRDCDIFGRWGGDEFIAIILKVKKNQLKKISDNFIRIIEKKIFNEKKRGFHIKISAGYTLIHKDDDLLCLIDRADRNMYKKKLKVKVSRNTVNR